MSLGADELAQFRQRLVQARERLLEQARVGRVSRMDALQGQAMSRASQQRRQQALRAIGAALARIDAGDYGHCAACGEPIDRRRLAHEPATPLCIDCAHAAESG